MSLLGHGEVTVGDALFNLCFSTLGNIVGGALFLGLPFAYINPSSSGDVMDEK